MKKIVLLFLTPLFIFSQDYKYKPNKELLSYDYSPLWTFSKGEDYKSYLQILDNTTFGISYFGNSVKNNVSFDLLSINFISGYREDNKDGDYNWGDERWSITSSIDYLFDSNAYSFDRPSDEIGTAFVTMSFEFEGNEKFNGNRPISGLSFGWLIYDNDKIFHKGGNVKSFRLLIYSKIAGGLYANGGFYFDKDRKTDERHDLPFFGLTYRLFE